MSKRAPEPVLLTDKEVAFFVGLSLHSLRSVRSNKPNLRMPPHIRDGGRVYYDLDDLLDWLLAKAVAPKRPGSSRVESATKPTCLQPR
jgi:hypothetical protein